VLRFAPKVTTSKAILSAFPCRLSGRQINDQGRIARTDGFAVADWRLGVGGLSTEEMEAATRPIKAMDRAKMRMASVIAGTSSRMRRELNCSSQRTEMVALGFNYVYIFQLYTEY
jgi:hypothetical protein